MDHLEDHLDKLPVFLETVRRGSIRAAARALGRSQPAVSRTIRLLEDAVASAPPSSPRPASGRWAWSPPAWSCPGSGCARWPSGSSGRRVTSRWRPSTTASRPSPGPPRR